MVNNGTYVDAMDNAWPYTLEWRAYYHAVVHHRNGESFSGDPFLDPVYAAQLYGHAYFHHRVLGIPMGSAAHFIFSAAADMVMGAVGVAVLWLYLHIGASAIHGMASAAAAGGKQPKEQPVVGLRRSPRNRKATKKYE